MTVYQNGRVLFIFGPSVSLCSCFALILLSPVCLIQPAALGCDTAARSRPVDSQSVTIYLMYLPVSVVFPATCRGKLMKIRALLIVSLIARVKHSFCFEGFHSPAQRRKTGGSPAPRAHISCLLLSDSEVLGKQCWTNVSNLRPFNQRLLSGIIIFHHISRGE